MRLFLAIQAFWLILFGKKLPQPFAKYSPLPELPPPPRSRADALSPMHVKELARALRWSIDRTLADLERKDAATPAGESLLVSGGAANPFKIYGRKGTPCPRCKTTLARIELGGRTTTFCPGCQERLEKK